MPPKTEKTDYADSLTQFFNRTQFLNDMKASVPEQPSIDAPSGNAQGKLVDQYIKADNQRLEQQTSLLEKILRLTWVQVWLFNGVILVMIGAVMVRMFVFGESDFTGLFDFLKYYVGAVLVELLGMLAFISKSIFSSSYDKIMEKVSTVSSKRSR